MQDFLVEGIVWPILAGKLHGIYLSMRPFGDFAHASLCHLSCNLIATVIDHSFVASQVGKLSYDSIRIRTNEQGAW